MSVVRGTRRKIILVLGGTLKSDLLVSLASRTIIIQHESSTQCITSSQYPNGANGIDHSKVGLSVIVKLNYFIYLRFRLISCLISWLKTNALPPSKVFLDELHEFI